MSKTMLRSLARGASPDALQVCTVHSEARRLTKRHQNTLRIAESRDLRNYIARVISEPRTDGQRWAFSPDDADFLTAEIERLIFGHGVANREMYVEYSRSGRKRALQKPARHHVWDILENMQSKLKNIYEFLGFEELISKALSFAKPEYDYVFIDEAQDLTPNAIRFCVALAKNPQSIYLTADINQSIYGRGMSWSSISSSLRFTGRAKHLDRNYRCTREICAAITELTKDIPDADAETLKFQAVYRGPKPVMQFYSDENSEIRSINDFLRHALNEADLPSSSAVILVRDTNQGLDLCRRLPAEFNARFFASKGFEVDHAGLVITTVQAAKGLEFPVVVVAEVNEGVFPAFQASIDKDSSAEDIDNELRMLHVACSRASRSLMVMAAAERRSRFLKHATPANWDVRPA